MFYGIFASGERQPWGAPAETQPLLAPVDSVPELSRNVSEEDVGNSKFSKSLFQPTRKRSILNDLDEDGNPSWFLNTI